MVVNGTPYGLSWAKSFMTMENRRNGVRCDGVIHSAFGQAGRSKVTALDRTDLSDGSVRHRAAV